MIRVITAKRKNQPCNQFYDMPVAFQTASPQPIENTHIGRLHEYAHSEAFADSAMFRGFCGHDLWLRMPQGARSDPEPRKMAQFGCNTRSRFVSMPLNVLRAALL